MMKSTATEQKLQATGIAKSLGLGMSKKTTMTEDLKSAWKRGGILAAAPIVALIAVLFALAAAMIVGTAIALSILRGWVLTYLWGWFIVPFGVQAIGVAHAIGLSLIFGFMVRIMFHDALGTDDLKRAEKRILEAFGKEPTEDKKAWKRTLGKLVIQFISPLVALGMGYIVHSYMM